MLMAALIGGCAGPTGSLDGDEAAEAPPVALTADGDALAPEVFAFSGEALWDGRPSLGGVWVAHPEVEAPGRVLIRHADTGAEVTGALFRREGASAGPPLQVSSDAAAALGLVAGQPAPIEVTALRRVEEAPDPGLDPSAEVGPTDATLEP